MASLLSKSVRLFSKPFGRRKKTAGIANPSADYSIRCDWSRSDGSLNYSSFVFFDVDRNGIYTLGDRPMGGIAVRLSGRHGHIATATTNSNGFANFSTSLAKKKANIRGPGRYEFNVSVPSGWAATGENSVQSKEFQKIAGSSSGIGTAEMLRPVGLAPPRTIRGMTTDGVSLSATPMRNSVSLSTTEALSRPAFCYQVPDEADSVLLVAGKFERRVGVSSYPIDVGVLDPKREYIDADKTFETIGFDDVNPRGLRKIPSGYAGLNWFNLNAIARDFSGGSQGYVNGNTSGDHMAYTSSGHPGELSSVKPFDFIGVHLSAAWLAAEGETGKIESWRGDKLVAVDTIELSALTPVFYCPMIPDVTRIRFSTEHYWQMVIDDLIVAR